MARVGARRFMRAKRDAPTIEAFNRHFRAQFVELQSLFKRVADALVTVENKSVRIRREKEVEQDFPLRRQQRGKKSAIGRRHILRDDPLQKLVRVWAGESKDGSVGEGEF